MPMIARRLLLATVCLAAASAARADDGRYVLVPFSLVSTHYDGVTNDLLTAGLGAAGLQAGTAPAPSNPPTPEQLRQIAILNNYRALVDTSPGGGYGLFWGPTVGVGGATVPNDGKVAGTETLAFVQEPDGSRITVMLQVPDSFDPRHACLVAGPSSGSRGVYGAIATAGEWGLKHGCAVAYTDKGSGAGFEDLHNALVTDLRGELVPLADPRSQFTAPIPERERAAFDAAEPDRFAFKHAHSQVDPEASWGTYTLQSIRFGLDLLGQRYPGLGKRNTVVIASSVSNGGGASLRAAEQDTAGLIDGVAVDEPNVNPVPARFAIQQGAQPPFTHPGRPLIDYVTLQNLYEGCAVANPAGGYLLNLIPSPGRCAALHAAGLLGANDLAGQSAEAQRVLNEYGILPEQNALEGVMWASYVPQAIAVTYANAYGRFSVLDTLCRYSFAATDPTGTPAPLATPLEQQLFGLSNGIPPTPLYTGVQIIDDAAGKEITASTPDQDITGALCLRSLATGRNAATGAPLSFGQDLQAARIALGVVPILATGRLRVPAIIATGRSDDVLPPNFASRAYVGRNRLEGGDVRYLEVKNAQHLDDILELAAYGIPQRYLPLQRYFVLAMDAMYAHLTQGAPLPTSQVVQTVPRGGTAPAVPPITAANVPPLLAEPGANAITFRDRVLFIPE